MEHEKTVSKKVKLELAQLTKKAEDELVKLLAENVALKQKCEQRELNVPEVVFVMKLKGVEMPEIQNIPEKPDSYEIMYRYKHATAEKKKDENK